MIFRKDRLIRAAVFCFFIAGIANANIYNCSVECKFSNGKTKTFKKIVNTEKDFDNSQQTEDGSYFLFLGQREMEIGDPANYHYKESIRAYMVRFNELELRYEYNDDRQHYPTGPLSPRLLAKGVDGSQSIEGSNESVSILCRKK